MQIAKQNLNEVVVDVLCQLKVLKTHEIFILKEKNTCKHTVLGQILVLSFQAILLLRYPKKFKRK